MNKEMPTTQFTKVQIEEMLKHDGRVVYLYNNLEQRWLTPQLQAMRLDEKGMGFPCFS